MHKEIHFSLSLSSLPLPPLLCLNTNRQCHKVEEKLQRQRQAAAAAEDEVRKRDQRKVFCPHCQCYLAKKTFGTHKRLYYDNSSERWIKKRQLIEASCANEDFCDLPQFDAMEERMPSDDDLPPMVTFDTPPILTLVPPDDSCSQLPNIDDSGISKDSTVYISFY